jgi:hypothetical protein
VSGFVGAVFIVCGHEQKKIEHWKPERMFNRTNLLADF